MLKSGQGPGVNLGGTNISGNIELSLHAVDNDVQVELAHALNHCLVGLIIPGEVEGGVLLR